MEGWDIQVVGYETPPGYCCRWRSAPVSVVKIASLTWEKADPSNDPISQVELEDCPNNGGKRIFPDKLDPNDNPDPLNLRRTVKLVATITPPKPGVTVYFKVFDVDDPFDNENSLMPDVSLIDTTPTTGPDNRPSPEVPWSTSAVTGANGLPADEAEVTFTVSMQPGNNYRAGASLLQEALNQNTTFNGQTLTPQQNADLQNMAGGIWSGYSTPLTWSPMLTVWRKLHVEADSMSFEPTTTPEREPDWEGVYITGGSAGASTTTLTLGVFAPPPSPHQCEGGSLLFTGLGLPPFSVRDHTNNSVEINGVLTAQQIAQLTNHSAVLKDDDPDSGLLPKLFAMSDFVKNAYKYAYIDIVNIQSDYNPRQTVDFQIYVSESEMTSGFGWNDAKDQNSQEIYWTALIVAGYQPGGLFEPVGNQFRDNDPDPLVDNSTYPSGPYWGPPEYAETAQDGWTSAFGDWDSMVFRGIIVDFPQYSYYEDQTIAHEIGHSGGNTGTEASHHAEGGLMREHPTADDTTFTSVTIKRFREAIKW